MDPLSALAIAAAAFQFLELGGKLCIKAWEKYKHIQEEIPDDQILAEEEKELQKTLEDLSSQVSWFRNVSKTIVTSQPLTPGQAQLLKLSSQCTSLSNDFERIKNKLKLPNSQETNLEIHLRSHVGSNLILRRNMPEAKCRDCQKAKDEEKAEIQKNQEDVEKIKRKLEPLRRNIMDFILLSLWDDSKRTAQWELHFSNQLDKLIALLGCTENLSMNNSLESALSNQRRLTQNRNDDVGSPKEYIQEYETTIIAEVDREAIKLRNALQPVIQPGKGPASLVQLAEDMIDYFQTDGVAQSEIRAELINVLWKNDWKLDKSMASAKIDTTITAHAIATGIQFKNIQTREDAISKKFATTYSWIFQDEPPEKDDMPMWYSFPEWLKDDSKRSYWITGKPGSGKSTILKLVLQQKPLRGLLSQSLGPMRLVLVNTLPQGTQIMRCEPTVARIS